MYEEEHIQTFGPPTEAEMFARLLEENVEVEIVGTIGGPELEDYLAELAIMLWMARPAAEEKKEVG
jgi:hypothetical protein